MENVNSYHISLMLLCLCVFHISHGSCYPHVKTWKEDYLYTIPISTNVNIILVYINQYFHCINSSFTNNIYSTFCRREKKRLDVEDDLVIKWIGYSFIVWSVLVVGKGSEIVLGILIKQSFMAESEMNGNIWS